MSDTITTALTFLYATLSGDTTLMALVSGVYQDIAPVGTVPDYVTFGIQSPGNDTLTSTAVRILSEPLALVRAIGPQADMSNLSAAATRIDTLLKLVRNDPATGVLCCYRVSPFYLPEPQLVNGAPWVEIGGLYRIEV